MLHNDNIMTANAWGNSEDPYKWKRLSQMLLVHYSFQVAIPYPKKKVEC